MTEVVNYFHKRLQFEFQNGGTTHDFERQKIDTANKENFSGRIEKTRRMYYKYKKF